MRAHHHQDTLFAAHYFDQHEAWRSGNHSQVSLAWATAFVAADHGTVTATATCS